MAAYDVELDPARAARIVDELTAIRERGLEELDVPTGTEKPKEVPEVEALANAYCTAAQIPVYGRAAGIRAVLRAALVAYARWGNDSESQVLAMLFFDLPSTKQPRPRPQRRRRPSAHPVG